MKNHNFSNKRMAIYNAICSTDAHPSAKTVYNMLKADYPDLSLGTVYRNISLFKEEKVVNVVGNVNGEERIDGNTLPHAHFICTGCSGVYDIFDDNLTALKDKLNNNDFKIKSENVVFYGLCKKCNC